MRIGRRTSILAGIGTADPTAFIGFAWSKLVPPPGINRGEFTDDVADRLCAAIAAAFEPEEQTALIAKLLARIVDQATWCFVVHDLNPRALSPRVKGFVQARSWQQDLTRADLV
jgi:peptide/nickel transport system substrate-binding protein